MTSVPALRGMKREGKKIVGVVAWDYQMAQIAERAGVDLVSVGDSVGVNLWGHASEEEITLEEMLIVCKAVRRGVERAVLSCDLPPQYGTDAAHRLVQAGGAQMIKFEGSAEAVQDLVRAGITVFAQFDGKGVAAEELVARARELERAGASLLDFRNSGPDAGAAVVRAVSIPVLGGLGGGPWLDGRIRMAHAAIGYAASSIDRSAENYANVARVALDALSAYAADVRAARQIKGSRPA